MWIRGCYLWGRKCLVWGRAGDLLKKRGCLYVWVCCRGNAVFSPTLFLGHCYRCGSPAAFFFSHWLGYVLLDNDGSLFSHVSAVQKACPCFYRTDIKMILRPQYVTENHLMKYEKNKIQDGQFRKLHRPMVCHQLCRRGDRTRQAETRALSSAVGWNIASISVTPPTTSPPPPLPTTTIYWHSQSSLSCTRFTWPLTSKNAEMIFKVGCCHVKLGVYLWRGRAGEAAGVGGGDGSAGALSPSGVINGSPLGKTHQLWGEITTTTKSKLLSVL